MSIGLDVRDGGVCQADPPEVRVCSPRPSVVCLVSSSVEAEGRLAEYSASEAVVCAPPRVHVAGSSSAIAPLLHCSSHLLLRGNILPSVSKWCSQEGSSVGTAQNSFSRGWGIQPSGARPVSQKVQWCWTRCVLPEHAQETQKAK